MPLPELGRAVLELATDDRQLYAGLDRVKQRATGLKQAFANAGQGARGFGSAMTDAGRTAGTAMDGLERKALKVGKAIVAGLSVAAIGGVIKSFVDTAGKIQDLASKAGMGVEAFQRLSYAARLNGGSMEQVAAGAAQLAKRLVEGDKSVVSAVGKLGLNLDRLRQMDPADAFMEIGDAIASVPNPMQQAALATQLFGKAGADYLPMFKGNLRDTAAEAQRLGLVLSKETIDAADEFGDTLDKLKLLGTALLSQALTPTLPILTELATEFGKLAADIIPKLVKGFGEAASATRQVVGGIAETWKELPRPVRDVALAVGEVTAAVWLLNRAIVALQTSTLIGSLKPVAGHLKDIIRLVQFGGWGGLALVFRNWGAAISGSLLGPLSAVVGGLSLIRAMAGSWKGAFEDIGSVLSGRIPMNTYLQSLGIDLADIQAKAGATQAALKTLSDLGIKPVASHAGAAAPPVRELSDAQKKLLDQFRGRDVLTKAHDYALVLRTIGEASKLTAAEQVEFRQAFDAVVEKYRRLGPAGAPVVAHFEALAATIPLAARSLASYVGELPEAVNQSQAISRALQGLAADGTLAATQIGSAFGAATSGFGALAPVVESSGRDITATLEDAEEATADWSDAWSELSRAFADFAQIAGPALAGVVRGIGAVVSALELMSRASDTIKKAQAAFDAATNAAQRTAASIQMVGGALSAAAAAFSLPLAIAAAFEEADRKARQTLETTRQLRESFIESAGGVDELTRKLAILGVSWQAWADLLDRTRNNAKQTQRILEHLSDALDDLERRQEAARNAAALVGELVAQWIAPIREAKENTETWGKAIGKLKPEAQRTFNSLSAYAVAAFAAILKTTDDFYAALKEMGPILDDLIEGQKALGLKGNAAITELLKLREVQKEYEKFLGPLNTATQAVLALEAAGILSAEAMQALATDAVSTFNRMVKGGVDAKVAMALMQPTLQTLWRLWKDGKIAVDAETEALLKQAEAHGIVGENQKSINEKMLDAFQDLKKAIDAMTVAITNWGKAAEAGFRRATDAAIAYGHAVPRGTPPVPGGGSESTPDPNDPPPNPDDTVPTPQLAPGAAVFRMHRGGPVSPRYVGASLWAAGAELARAHTGLLVGPHALAADERPIIAQVGEEVVEKPVATLARRAIAAMGSREGAPVGGARAVSIDARTDVTINATVIDADDFDTKIERDIGPKLADHIERGHRGLRTRYRVALGLS
jgi:methyl-accepting chemotaxis protein